MIRGRRKEVELTHLMGEHEGRPHHLRRHKPRHRHRRFHPRGSTYPLSSSCSLCPRFTASRPRRSLHSFKESMATATLTRSSIVIFYIFTISIYHSSTKIEPLTGPRRGQFSAVGSAGRTVQIVFFPVILQKKKLKLKRNRPAVRSHLSWNFVEKKPSTFSLN